MRVIILVSLLASALAAPPQQLFSTNYHEDIGIPAAARIKAIEEGQDFDGARIVGGSGASLGQYPHMGGLVITLNSGATSVCGSSLLSNTRAVTAAHCWISGSTTARQFVVVLGSTTLFFGGTRITTSNVVAHENYNANTIQNDVAVITLSWVNYSNNIRNIILPPANLQNENFAGHWASAAGFGAQRDGAGISTAQTLHHVHLQIITNMVCQSFYGNSIIASTLCIDGTDRRSTCGGDSGGPLAIRSNNQDVLVGITSFGYIWGCERGWPAGFARVTSFQNWIQARL